MPPAGGQSRNRQISAKPEATIPAKEVAVPRAKEKGIGGAPTKGRRRASVPRANSTGIGMEMPSAPMSRMERIHHASHSRWLGSPGGL